MLSELVAPLAPVVALSGAAIPQPATSTPAKADAGSATAIDAVGSARATRQPHSHEARPRPRPSGLEAESLRALADVARARAAWESLDGDPALLGMRGFHMLASVAELRARIVPPAMTTLDRRA